MKASTAALRAGVSHQPGELVDYSGWPGSTLEPADATAKRIKDHYIAERTKGARLPRHPDIAIFSEPAKAAPKAATPVKDKTDG